ncbi:bifunctional histidinol-phosphatase/imidazoleglycerol-phosphate dehydratase HisB [Saccharicrinis fermentans]|uniref:Histidine biosynthesis bifunctional protein HisB n=1 Tax=Saccharicrinis fermentans DSM 9555 = JCM 21142 TaxID=869213 RepID=W7YGG2_9BACT|nr:bifunctional histidinol-phosphatase/imidazoleglycerol-phosphate dehydratase HisB [Saccharicrinis fermentans]GAF01694.1 histidine biosynthesis bifunctional protein HisB [Saccharicrinis fermentans DSM 9555 = JCM 21142]
MQRVLFIDRDGTIIEEPPTDFQVDSLEKLAFYPKVITNLHKIANDLDFELAMVTNQDGLGTASFPENTFWPAQNKMMNTLKGEGILFDEVFIDPSLPEENSPRRKPGTAMLTKYFDESYDMANSYVIGDRMTDVLLAKNMGCKAIFLKNHDNAHKEIESQGLKDICALCTTNWDEITQFLFAKERTAHVSRKTSETEIDIQLNLDGSGQCNISTGLHFFDHMLEQIGKHSGCDLSIKVNGDLHVDEHHTIEDTALALGQAFKEALGDKRGIERYGYCLPMDDCLALVTLDFGGRPWLVWEADFKREKVGDMPSEMFLHFFKSFSDASLSNLQIQAKGDNEHHKIEGIFKALARALKMAIKKDVFNNTLPSTKGAL